MSFSEFTQRDYEVIARNFNLEVGTALYKIHYIHSLNIF